MKETNILKECLMALSKAGVMAWRQNTGALKDSNGRLVQYGLCKGSSDIIGIGSDGVFIAIEVKALGGKIRPEQQTFIDNIRRMGGRAGVARSADEAVRIAPDLDG